MAGALTGDWVRARSVWLVGAAVVAVVGGLLVSISPLGAIAAVVGTLLFATIVARPSLALPLLYMAVLSSDRIDTGLTLVVPLTVSKITTLMVLISWLCRCVLLRQWPLKNNALWAPILACSAVVAVGMVRSREITAETIAFVLGVGLLFSMLQVVASIYQPRHLSQALLLVALGYTASICLAIPFGGEVDGYDYNRHVGFVHDPNNWSLSVMLGLGPTIAIFENQKNLLLRSLAIVAVVAAGINILMTVSRAGTLTLIVIMPLLFVILWRRKWLLMTAGTVATAAVFTLVDLSALWTRFDSFFDAGEFEVDGSMQERSALVGYAIDAFFQHPVFGIGTQSFAQDVQVISGGAISKVAHNTYLQILAEQGLVGAVAFGWLGITLLGVVIAMWRRQPSKRFRRLALGFTATTVSYVAMAATLNLMTFAPFYFMLGLLMVLDQASRMSPSALASVGLADPDDPAVLADMQAMETTRDPQAA